MKIAERTQVKQAKGLIVANWKLNGSMAMATDWLADFNELMHSHPLKEVTIVVCPPYPYIPLLSASALRVGAQNISLHDQGAFTGEVSTAMLADFNVEYVIVGHSERRTLFSETSDMVAKKAALALMSGLTPIVCVGETLEQRDSDCTFKVLDEQLAALLAQLSPVQCSKVMIAYEPIWAIGTGKTASAEQADAVHQWIEKWFMDHGVPSEFSVPVIYGGSVKPSNAASILSKPSIKGVLVGGASLKAKEFFEIANAWHVASHDE